MWVFENLLHLEVWMMVQLTVWMFYKLSINTIRKIQEIATTTPLQQLPDTDNFS